MSLPSPSMPLSTVVPCEGIKAANKEVNKVPKGMKSAVEYTCSSNGSARLQPLEYCEGLMKDLHLRKKLR